MVYALDRNISTLPEGIPVAIQDGAHLFDAQELRCWGACDAAFGDPVRFYNGHYLAGYLKKLGELPRDKQGRILYGTKPAATYQGWTEQDPQPVTDY
ncbi:MAG TPA: hypothetical protein V6D29_01335 [Leptolyngbyaceae cyanobacterium]